MSIAFRGLIERRPGGEAGGWVDLLSSFERIETDEGFANLNPKMLSELNSEFRANRKFSLFHNR